MRIQLDLPEAVAGKDVAELSALARESLIVRLYALGELTSGEGAEMLGISRREFLDLLGQYNVSIFDDTADLTHERRVLASGPVVSNTTPLINLAGIGLLDLLPQLYGALLVPQAVVIEFEAKAQPSDPQLGALPWLTVEDSVAPDPTLPKLGAGEAAAISLAIAVQARLILIHASSS
jgi:predicted HTH domain antitoxin